MVGASSGAADLEAMATATVIIDSGSDHYSRLEQVQQRRRHLPSTTKGHNNASPAPSQASHAYVKMKILLKITTSNPGRQLWGNNFACPRETHLGGLFFQINSCGCSTIIHACAAAARHSQLVRW